VAHFVAVDVDRFIEGWCNGPWLGRILRGGAEGGGRFA
jgi:hypothetical protein